MNSPIFIGLPGDRGIETVTRFCQDYFDKRRLIAKWSPSMDKFRLVDGSKWYELRLYPSGNTYAIFDGRAS